MNNAQMNEIVDNVCTQINELKLKMLDLERSLYKLKRNNIQKKMACRY